MGDVPAAIGISRSILSQNGIARPLAARALLQLGQCQEKLGQRREAHATYTRLRRGFSDESDTGAQARPRPADLTHALPGPRRPRFAEGGLGEVAPARVRAARVKTTG